MLRDALSTARRGFHRRSRSTAHDKLTATTPKKPFAHLVAPQPATAQLAPTLHSQRNSRADLPPRTGPGIRKTRRFHTATPSPSPRQPRCRPHLRPAHQIPISSARDTAPIVPPFPRFRPLEVFGRRPRCVFNRSWRPASENTFTLAASRAAKEIKSKGCDALHRSLKILAIVQAACEARRLMTRSVTRLRRAPSVPTSLLRSFKVPTALSWNVAPIWGRRGEHKANSNSERWWKSATNGGSGNRVDRDRRMVTD